MWQLRRSFLAGLEQEVMFFFDNDTIKYSKCHGISMWWKFLRGPRMEPARSSRMNTSMFKVLTRSYKLVHMRLHAS